MTSSCCQTAGSEVPARRNYVKETANKSVEFDWQHLPPCLSPRWRSEAVRRSPPHLLHLLPSLRPPPPPPYPPPAPPLLLSGSLVGLRPTSAPRRSPRHLLLPAPPLHLRRARVRGAPCRPCRAAVWFSPWRSSSLSDPETPTVRRVSFPLTVRRVMLSENWENCRAFTREMCFYGSLILFSSFFHAS